MDGKNNNFGFLTRATGKKRRKTYKNCIRRYRKTCEIQLIHFIQLD